MQLSIVEVGSGKWILDAKKMHAEYRMRCIVKKLKALTNYL